VMSRFIILRGNIGSPIKAFGDDEKFPANMV
jgi:hypothetical protein